MSRLRVIIGGTALAILAAAVPIAVMAYATWDRAVSVEQQRLRDIAGRTCAAPTSPTGKHWRRCSRPRPAPRTPAAGPYPAHADAGDDLAVG